jgi:hypothetical protein
MNGEHTSKSAHGTEETITVVAHKKALQDLEIRIGLVAMWLGNGCDPDRAENELELICDEIRERTS